MKRNVLIPCFLFLFIGSLFAQKKTDEEAVRVVADNILAQPVTQFVSVDDGTVYNSTAEIPEGKDVRFKSPLTEWHYSNGVLDMAMINLGEYLNEDKYVEYAKRHVAFGFDNYKYFKNTFRHDRNHWHWPFGQLWNMKELDDCGAMGAAVIEVYQLKKEQRYLDYIHTAANHIMEGQDRLEDGTLSRTFPRNMTVWADDAYMGTSFLTRMGKFTGENRYFDEAAKQLILMDEYLWCPEKQLYYHCYYTDWQRNGVAYWGRANGWIMISLVDLIEAMPQDHAQRGELISILEKQIVGASRWQNANGMWNQLLDKSDSYDESSVTAMFVYGIAKAINNRWIDPAYQSIARSGWNALKDNEITPDGRFTNVCVGTGISNDLPFYFNRPVGDNEKHGLGLIINTAVEIMKLSNTQ
ncbi:glycoside hydrolase family 105 protein [Proteiniphilum sp. X52]|uniref:glycoside hydrolase family 88/105 protein n=1 Tax=Proteiniphilum sp. X52 TaxID=2382159 RepID=UPI000F0A41E6|nr:glycoside hydrolase family 88 protein [Proteiniphilum sp. X52]RNC65963.1 glycosyl hydrolase [Proteiniphilum sp. X52]